MHIDMKEIRDGLPPVSTTINTHSRSTDARPATTADPSKEDCSEAGSLEQGDTLKLGSTPARGREDHASRHRRTSSTGFLSSVREKVEGAFTFGSVEPTLKPDVSCRPIPGAWKDPAVGMGKPFRQRNEEPEAIQHQELQHLRQKLQEMAAGMTSQRAYSEKYIRHLQEEVQGSHNAISRANAEIEDLKRQLEMTSRNLGEARKLLDDRAEELTVARTFLNSADQNSPADVVEAMRHLNEEIYQCAISLGDVVLSTNELDASSKNVQRAERYQRRFAKQWDGTLLSRLTEEVKQGDTVVLEGVVRHHLSNWCKEIISTFSAIDQVHGPLLDSLGRHVYSSKGRLVARNWFALTYSHLNGLEEVDTSFIERNLRETMRAAGWMPTPDASEESSRRVPPDVLENVRLISKKALEIKAMIIEGVLSSDLQPYVLDAGTPFAPDEMDDEDSAGTSMADSRANHGSPQDRHVACTTALGLQKFAPAPTSGEGREYGALIRTLLLKPKVLLA
ncbi:hypothetical protein DFP72DRAFT_1133902 [Ephemerocybe angulata]|uniref:Uncharacterized protein n=1 Tax=Ephemerocybe angulata TaxID=980116 RepID=A0A8H6M1N3_9AGAR|nr:hypothetical protein DFP72DRAFT_1133902 [Tulosesus angulatus]